MILLIKRFLLLFLSLCCLLNCTVYASDYFSLDTSKEFFVYGKNDEKLAKALGIAKDEISAYCGKNVIYLAVNKDNSKQIRITTGQNAFTYSTVNISNLSNDKISALIPEITGIENIKGEIILKNGQKFIKTELQSEDSGGAYILTQYMTVADKRSFLLSFYTDVDVDKGYIDEVFQTFECDYFENQKEESKRNILEYVLPAFTIVFAVVCVVIVISVLVEVRARNIPEEVEEVPEDESTDENEGAKNG